MPWKERSIVEERMRFVLRLKDGGSMASLCREFAFIGSFAGLSSIYALSVAAVLVRFRLGTLRETTTFRLTVSERRCILCTACW